MTLFDSRQAWRSGQIPAHVPAELANRQNWLVWRLIQKPNKAKPDKVPFYVTGAPRSGTQGTTTDRSQLATYHQALRSCKDGGFSGVGFAILPGDGVVALDFDNCVKDGTIDPRVAMLVDETYAEISPSGTGVRAFMTGDIRSQKDNASKADRNSDGTRKDGLTDVEIFGNSGFVTVTGNVTPTCDLFGLKDTMIPLTPEVKTLYAVRFGERQSAGSTSQSDDLSSLPSPRMGWTNADLQGILSDLNPSMPREPWLDVLMAAHYEMFGDLGTRDILVEWSSTGENYAGPKDIEDRWRSFDSNRPGHQITGRTLLMMRRKEVSTHDGVPSADGGRVDMTDAGNVNALFEITRGDMSFVFGTKAFMHWDGVRWVLDPTRVQATTAVLGVAEHYRGRAKAKYREADHATTTDDKKRLVKLAESLTTWANYCRSRRGIDAMLALAERDPRFVRDINDLDKDPYLFGVANGVVDLRTGDLRPAAREDLVTKASPFEFDPHASTKAMAEFVREICSLPIDDGATTGPMTYQVRPEQERYMQKVLGYWLTGRVNEQKMWVLTGGGANGKSVLMDVVAKVLGAYAVSLPPEVLMASARPADAESPTPFARTLAGARLAISSEPREGQRLAASVIKRHTGEARLTARGMRENGFTFDTTHKLVLMTNDQPHIDHPDDAIRSRLHVVPFDRTWNRRDSMVYNPRLPYGDGSLLDRLLGDAKGVLLWLIEGARSYFKEGLDTAPAVKATTAEYLRVQDHFTVWLEGMEACDPSIGTPAATLFEAYQRFCTRQGAERPHPNNPTAFGLALKARNVQRGRAAGGQRYGLRGDTNNGASLF
mgnify:CR=1 FL=1